MNIEMELARVLRRESAPEGFTQRVVDRATRSAAATRRGAFLMRAAAAVLIVGTIAGGWAAERAVERRQGERARAEVLLALRIAGSKIRTAQRQVRDISSR